MKDLPEIYFPDESSFRKWLTKNNETSTGIWMLFYKSHTGKKCIDYQEALEEALCYGWIDSIIKKIDEDKYARKFTPRTDTLKWSEINKRKAEELIKNGKMTEFGLRKIDSYNKTGKVKWGKEVKNNDIIKTAEVPAFIINALEINEPALNNFNRMAPSYRRRFILWIMSAKREETRMIRLNESIGLLRENKKLGLK